MDIIWWHVIVTVWISYFCGNISFARMIARTKHDDITKLGSGNPGSTNTLRQYGFKLGALNLLLDMLKCFIPCLAAYYIFDKSYLMLYVAGVSCIVGHIYPIVWGFKGGKGVATIMGLFFAANPIISSIVLAVGFVVWVLFESGAVVSFLCITVLTVYEGIRMKSILSLSDRKIVCVILFVIFLFALYAHRKNIDRLMLGKENKASLIKKTKKKLKSKKT